MTIEEKRNEIISYLNFHPQDGFILEIAKSLNCQVREIQANMNVLFKNGKVIYRIVSKNGRNYKQYFNV